jgi:uncharacterized membrane protein
MVFVKSILAGVVALAACVLVAVATFAGWGWWVIYWSREGGSVGFVSFSFNSPWIALSIFPILIVAAVVFLAGFYWKFRRLTTSNRRSH